LTIDHLQVVEKAQWEASDVKIRNCVWKGQSEIDCRNYINVLHANKNELIACGTDAFSPNCTKREVSSLTNNILAGLGKINLFRVIQANSIIQACLKNNFLTWYL